MTQLESFDRTLEIFSALDLTAVAILLDVDGTILDIGPAPDAVHVSDDLRSTLERLLALTDGALALVSGRPLADLDRLFAPLELSAIGGHGAEIRIEEMKLDRGIEPLPHEFRKQLKNAVPRGVLVEDKGYSLALHYRAVPNDESNVRRLLKEASAAFPDEALEILSGKKVFEAKRPGVSKGEAVRALMEHAPFEGRAPVFIGDDVTDESVFALLPELGGVGFSVGRRFDELAGMFHTPAAVRDALERLAAGHHKSAP